MLCGLVESESPLLKAWLSDDPQAPRSPRRPSMIRRSFDEATERIVAEMNLGDDEPHAA
jgi:hypothetical protein